MSRALYINFLSLVLKVYCGTKLLSCGITYLSNLFNAVRHDAVFFYHIFFYEPFYFDPYFYSKISLSFCILNGCSVSLFRFIGGSLIKHFLP